MTQTRTQRMARLALERVQQAAKDKEFAKKYKPRAMSFATMVMQSGLAQAAGFLMAKSGGKVAGDEYGQYLDDVARVAGQGSGKAFFEEALRADLARYRLLTREALDASGWLKRMTQTLIASDDKSGQRNP
ncbi:MAG: type III-B CRISPR module-associated protein Cmr5 [Proteobacteria bacterium]|nr:type III-B CRISPR module-associated protein Cmr5 [Pseudomonadota bacterium]